MKKILQEIFFNNSIEQYLYVFSVIFIALLLKRVVSKYLARLLFRLVGNAEKNSARNSFLSLVVQPLDYFLVVLIAIIALDRLTFPSVLNFKLYRISVKDLIDSLTNGVLIFVFIWLGLRIIEFIAMVLEEKANQTEGLTDNQLILFFKDFFKAILVIIGVLLILRFSFNKDISNLLTGLSIVGAALALATRESLENLIASFIIFFDKPFCTGDLVKVNGFTGMIEKIGLRSTRIRTLEKTYISVPNKQMVDNIVDNISLRTHHKAEFKFEIELEANAKQLTDLITAIQALLENESVENILVVLADTGKNAHIVVIEYLTGIEQSTVEFLQQKQAITLRILSLMENNKIQMAAAATDVVIHNAS